MAALVAAGYAVRAATRGSASFPTSVDTVIVPDFKCSIDWNPILQGVDVVVHLGAIAHVDTKTVSYNLFDQINRVTTHELARAAKDAGVRHFVYISSVRAQTGPSATGILNERDVPRPTDHYGRSKLAAESSVRSANISFTIFRPVVVYGPNPTANIRTLFQLASLPLPMPFKALTSRRSVLGIDNLVSAIIFSLNNENTFDEEFLVADSRPITLVELFTVLREAKGRAPRVIYLPPVLIKLALMLTGRIRFWERLHGDLVVDTSKLEALGWRPSVETHEGLKAAALGQSSFKNA